MILAKLSPSPSCCILG